MLAMSTSYELRRQAKKIYKLTARFQQRQPAKWIPLAGVELTTVNRDVPFALVILSSFSDRQPFGVAWILRCWICDRFRWLNSILKTISQRCLSGGVCCIVMMDQFNLSFISIRINFKVEIHILVIRWLIETDMFVCKCYLVSRHECWKNFPVSISLVHAGN